MTNRLEIAERERHDARKMYREARRYERRGQQDRADQYRAWARAANQRARRYEQLTRTN